MRTSPARSGRIRRTIAALVILLLTAFLSAPSVAQIEESTLKAVFIEKFTRFIEWPKTSGIDDTSKPFVVGIVGESDLEPAMRNIFADRKIRDKDVVIRHLSPDSEELDDCHLLFISHISKENLRKVLAAVKGRPILTVSDTENFATSGVLINFYVAQHKLRFEINELAVRKSNLTFSYRLMQIATIVNHAGSR